MTPYARGADAERERAVEKPRSASSVWTTRRGCWPARTCGRCPRSAAIGLGSLVMSDGPIGVRGTALDRRSTRRSRCPARPRSPPPGTPDSPAGPGRLLAQEAHRKGVHVLLAPTVNLHRSPLGGRHFEAYSEDPYLTGADRHRRTCSACRTAASASPSSTSSATTPRPSASPSTTASPNAPLRELYLAPFEAIVQDARPWGVMAAYNAVNGVADDRARRAACNGVLRGEWGFDGVVVSDWLAARATAGALARRPRRRDARPDDRLRRGAGRRRPGRRGAGGGSWTRRPAGCCGWPRGPALLAGAPAAVAGRRPARRDRRRRAGPRDRRPRVRPGAQRPRGGRPAARPRSPLGGGVALIGAAARDARILGGGSAQVFPDHVVSPLDGLRSALPAGAPVATRSAPTRARNWPPPGAGFSLRAVARDARRRRNWAANRCPAGGSSGSATCPTASTTATLHTVEARGTFVPAGQRRAPLRHPGHRRLPAHRGRPGALRRGAVGRRTTTRSRRSSAARSSAAPSNSPRASRSRSAWSDTPPVGRRTAHRRPSGSACCTANPSGDAGGVDRRRRWPPRARADTAVVVVATTERVESEGFDRTDLRLPGRQDDLVARVAAANPRTVVVVNAGSPVEMPWREDVAAVLLAWFPGQEAAPRSPTCCSARAEPGGRLPTTWPARLADAPVTRGHPQEANSPTRRGSSSATAPGSGAPPPPAYPFGHGLGYTDWEYERHGGRARPRGGAANSPSSGWCCATAVPARAGRSCSSTSRCPGRGRGPADVPRQPPPAGGLHPGHGGAGPRGRGRTPCAAARRRVLGRGGRRLAPLPGPVHLGGGPLLRRPAPDRPPGPPPLLSVRPRTDRAPAPNRP